MKPARGLHRALRAAWLRLGLHAPAHAVMAELAGLGLRVPAEVALAVRLEMHQALARSEASRGRQAPSPAPARRPQKRPPRRGKK
jgi:hypothetical protein